jgi:hypothetical protein
MFHQDRDVALITARLAAAAEIGEPLELILVVRGRVQPIRGTDRRRWLVRVEGRHRLTFRAEWVVAATPAAQARHSNPP